MKEYNRNAVKRTVSNGLPIHVAGLFLLLLRIEVSAYLIPVSLPPPPASPPTCPLAEKEERGGKGEGGLILLFLSVVPSIEAS